MTDEEAAIAHVKKRYWDKKNVEPEILAMDIKCGVEDFLAGVEYGRNNPWILRIDKEPPCDVLLDVAYSRYADVVATVSAWYVGNGIYRYNEAMKPGRELDDSPYAWRLQVDIPEMPKTNAPKLLMLKDKK